MTDSGPSMIDLANAGGGSLPSLGRGATIGRYVVLGLVGRGAMGEVYAAYDPELDRKVAVKLLRIQDDIDDLTAAEAKTRLLREAQAIARLSHPNVIVVHDVGSFGDRVFVAMEFVEGHTVGYWLLAVKRSWREILLVFLAAGRGLAAAHASQLVHRDFKVENVMVGHDGQVRVMDFGLARRVTNESSVSRPFGWVAADAAPSPDTGATAEPGAPSAIVDNADQENIRATWIRRVSSGTPVSRVLTTIDVEATRELSGPNRQRHTGPYLSGVANSLTTDLTQTGAIVGTPAYMAPEQFNGSPAGERSDQFSYCVALYEALYGERPFAGKTVAELSDNVRRGRLRPPPDTTRVPGWLRRVVLRGLRTDPAERWASMDALLDALQRDPHVAWRRWVWAAAAVAGIAGIGVAARRQGALESRPTCQASPERFARVWEANDLAGTRRATITAAFRSSGQPYAADALVGAGRLLDRYVGAWSSMYRDTCEATHLRGEQSAAVLDLRMSCLRERWNELRALSDVLADPNGEVVANAVKAAAALTPIERCADVRTLGAALPPPSDPTTRSRVEAVRTKLATAKALEDAGRFTKALTAAAPLVSDARAIGYTPVVADALYRLAEVQLHLGRADDAAANFDEAIWAAVASRYDQIAAASSVEQIYIAGDLRQDMPGARRWFRQAESFLARMDGQEILTAWMHNNFGVALESDGYFEEAVQSYRKALALKERVLGNNHPDVGLSLTNLAGGLRVLGRSDEALALSNRGVEIMERTIGPEHPDTATQWVNRAEIMNQLGRYADGLRDAERAVVVWERELGHDSADLPFLLAPVGEARLGLEQPLEAVAPLTRALQIAERHDLRSELRRLRFALARALWQSGGDRPRAIVMGSLAAAPLDTDNPLGSRRGFVARDEELQQRAVAWLADRQRELRKSGYRPTRRLGKDETF